MYFYVLFLHIYVKVLKKKKKYSFVSARELKPYKITLKNEHKDTYMFIFVIIYSQAFSTMITSEEEDVIIFENFCEVNYYTYERICTLNAHFLCMYKHKSV